MNIEIGDVVKVRGKYSPWEAVIGDVNYREGRVGFVKYEPEEWEEIKRQKREKNLRMEQIKYLIEQQGGETHRVPRFKGPRQFQWAPAKAVIEVVKKV